MCVSYTTVNRVTKSLALNHDQRVREWKSACSTTVQQPSSNGEPVGVNMVGVPSSTGGTASSTNGSPSDTLALPAIQDMQTTASEDTPPGCHPDFILVGDNIDKNVSPRDMRVDHLSKSYHYFHSYAVLDRIDLSAASNVIPDVDMESLPLTTFLPSLGDCKALRNNYVILASRVLVQHLRFLAPLRGCVPQHIKHAYSKEMMQKSDIVGYLFCKAQ